jgi:hypothetical protein
VRAAAASDEVKALRAVRCSTSQSPVVQGCKGRKSPPVNLCDAAAGKKKFSAQSCEKDSGMICSSSSSKAMQQCARSPGTADVRGTLARSDGALVRYLLQQLVTQSKHSQL